MFKVLFLLCLLLNYIETSHAQTNEACQKIRIDPSTAVGGSVSQFIDKVIFIPLENTKESQFGVIFQLEITEKYFIILDLQTNAILIFTKEGKFHAKIEVNKINHNGQPLFQFCFNKKTNLIEIPSYPENFFYDMDAKLVKKTINKIPFGSFGIFKTILGDAHTVYFNTDNEAHKDSVIYELMMYDEGGLTKKILPSERNYKLEEMEQIMNCKNFVANFEKGDSSVYYLHNFDNNVYRLTPNAIWPVYHFVFPLQTSLPKDFTTNPTYNNNRVNFYSKDTNLIVRLENFYKKNDLLFFSTGKLSYIYNVQSQHFICESKIVSDSLSYFLPITTAEISNRDGLGLINFDGTSFYTSISSLDLFNQMKATKNKKTQYPLPLSTYLGSEKNRIGNPVLVQIQFKSTL